MPELQEKQSKAFNTAVKEINKSTFEMRRKLLEAKASQIAIKHLKSARM